MTARGFSTHVDLILHNTQGIVMLNVRRRHIRLIRNGEEGRGDRDGDGYIWVHMVREPVWPSGKALGW